MKNLLLSSKTALFVFIHVDMILHIFQRNAMFSLSNLLSEMGVENSDSKKVLQITCPNPEATRDHVMKEQLVWFLKLPEGSSCSSSTRTLAWGPHLESLHTSLAKWLWQGKAIACAANSFLELTSPLPSGVCLTEFHGWAVNVGELKIRWLSLEEWPGASPPLTVMTATEEE